MDTKVQQYIVSSASADTGLVDVRLFARPARAPPASMAKSVAFDDLSGLSDEQQAVLKAFRDMDTDSDGELTAQGANQSRRHQACVLQCED